MQTILPSSGNTIKILGKARPAEQGLRWMHYVLAQPVDGGVLVFHTLTRALLLLTPEEYAAMTACVRAPMNDEHSAIIDLSCDALWSLMRHTRPLP